MAATSIFFTVIIASKARLASAAPDATEATNHSVFHPAFICTWEFGLEEPATSGKLRRIKAEKGDFR
jgi:hypothetical protein